VLLLLLLGPAAPAQSVSEKETFFETKIRPVLVGQCFKCHGGDKVSGGLRVDSREALLKGGDRGSAVVPGKPDRGVLLQALRHESGADLKMPPDRKLPAAVVEDFATWVRAGAVWPASAGRPDAFVARKHWAFQPVKAVAPPADPDGWSANPIDRFIAQRRRAVGLQPVGPADRRALLRRVTFDLIGLPPTPEQAREFLADTSPAFNYPQPPTSRLGLALLPSDLRGRVRPWRVSRPGVPTWTSGWRGSWEGATSRTSG
jgi:hypothetical protein